MRRRTHATQVVENETGSGVGVARGSCGRGGRGGVACGGGLCVHWINLSGPSKRIVITAADGATFVADADVVLQCSYIRLTNCKDLLNDDISDLHSQKFLIRALAPIMMRTIVYL